MDNGITLEDLGVPTATVVTSHFVGEARAQAAALGLPEYPVVVIQHPLTAIPLEQVHDRVDHAIDAIVAVLTRDPKSLPLELDTTKR